ncbi:MAG: RsmB/NOP family class I SAM-dependent RNA methyltransferase [Kiritimatiellia bacterium]
MNSNSRRTAAYVIARWIVTRDFPANLLPTGPDRAFVQDLVYTTIRRFRPLRKVLGALVRQWPRGELEALLYIGAAQILYMDDVPDFAAVNETVDAAKTCANPTVAKVVNGVLRNLIRRRAEFAERLAAAPVAERESLPGALYRRWVARFGAADAEKLAIWHNQPAETYLARRDGSFVVLERGTRVEEVPGFAAGEFIVQDPGTARAIEMLDLHPGETVLDACAAPGGKTVQIAWRGAAVTACEVNPKRRRRLEENLKRLNLSVTVVPELPAPDSGDPAGGLFAKVLVDAPCSNTGVLRRRPDARWNWTVEKLAATTRLQSEILENCARRVAPGGRLVYSTCSNEPEENLGQVEAFLARHPEFTLKESCESLPFETGHDGAFAAALIRAVQM